MVYWWNMESLFPELFFLSYFALVVIRVALAIVMLYDARALWGSSNANKPFAIGLVVLGASIGAGFLTQGMAIIASILILFLSVRVEQSVFNNRLLALLSLAILITLFLSGPGGLALDLPY